MPLVPPKKSLNKMLAEYRALQRQLPAIVGGRAVNYFKRSFQQQGWVDKGIEKWPARKAGAKRNKGRKLLIDSGRLRRSIRVVEKGEHYVIVGTDVPYGVAHNEGVDKNVNVRAHTRRTFKTSKSGTGVYSVKTKKEKQKKTKTATGSYKVRAFIRKAKIPRRRFMGDSAGLNRGIQREIENRLQNIL